MLELIVDLHLTSLTGSPNTHTYYNSEDNLAFTYKSGCCKDLSIFDINTDLLHITNTVATGVNGLGWWSWSYVVDTAMDFNNVYTDDSSLVVVMFKRSKLEGWHMLFMCKPSELDLITINKFLEVRGLKPRDLLEDTQITDLLISKIFFNLKQGNNPLPHNETNYEKWTSS